MGWSYTSNGGIVFDLDDPRFTSPMSVISGIASGYCERKAAVSAAYAAASWTTDAVKSNTVSRMAANIAINHNIGVLSAYGAGSETFQAPQSWTVGTSPQNKTFMDYFDHDLAALATNYVTRGGVAYDGFDSLAVAASARAASDVTVSNYTGYTVGTTATSGGVGGVAGTSEYTGTFVPMFAAGWAVERRDMLEELRYTPIPVIDDFYYCRESNIYFVSDSTQDTTLSINSVVHTGIATGELIEDSDNMDLHIQTDLRYGQFTDVSALTVNGASYASWAAASTIPAGDLTMVWHGDAGEHTRQVPAAYLGAVWTYDISPSGIGSACRIVTQIQAQGNAPAEIGLLIDDNITGEYPISVFLGKPYYFGTVPYFSDCYARVDTVSARVDTAYTQDDIPMYGNLIVLEGATVTVTDCWLDEVVVEPGGKLILDCQDTGLIGGPRIGHCCLLISGNQRGSVEGLFTDINHPGTGRYEPLIENMYLDFATMADYTNMTRCTLLTGGTISQIPDEYYSAAIVPPGITVTLQNVHTQNGNRTMETLFIQSGGTAIVDNTDDTAAYEISACWIEPGGTLIVHQLYLDSDGQADTSLTIRDLTICSGGTCTFDGLGMTKIPYAAVLSGGTLNLTELVGIGEGWDYYHSHMQVEDGAVVTLYDANGTAKTALKDIYEYRSSSWLPNSTTVKRFNSLGMTTADTEEPAVKGWNVINATFAPVLDGGTPTGSSYATLFVSTGALVVDNPQTIYFAGEDSATIYDGFEIVTYKGFRDIITSDHYPKFVYRKFGDDHK